jgi:AAA ATPase domain
VDPVHNPYRPGAGRRPPALAGRDPLLTAFDVVVRRSEELGEGDRGWILYGLRGVGKTVLLNELLRRAGERDWITAKVEAGAGESLSVALSQALVRGMRTATGRHPESRLRRLLGVFKAFSVKADATGMVSLGVDVEPIRGVADSGRFADDLAALFEVMGETARELGIGVLILVDELQEADAGVLAAINTALHHLGQAEMPLPMMLVGAGLPSLPAQLADATSYAERLYDYRPVGLLDRPAAVDALTIPTRALGVDWDDEALKMAADVAGGYPYFLQAIGKHVWDNAISSPITADDVQVGLHDARREVDDGLYRSRWERATPAQRDLLRALADLAGDESATVSALASRMHKSRASDLSVSRNELIKKGLVYPPERGILAFTVPGMHEFVLRQDVQEVE